MFSDFKERKDDSIEDPDYKKEVHWLLEELRMRYREVCESLGLDVEFQQEIQDEIDKLQDSVVRDYIVSRGEFLSAKIMAKYLGYEFVDAKELIYFNEAGELDEEKTYRCIENTLSREGHFVIPGFYGEDAGGNIKTFERGGSDITGSIIAGGLDASLYENWTDVSGIMTADPKKDPAATTIRQMTYEELLLISKNGAQVYHKDAVASVWEKNIPILIKNTNAPEESGTIVTGGQIMNIALLGFGTVGRGVWELLKENKDLIEKRIAEQKGKKIALNISKILVRDPEKYTDIPKELFVRDFSEIENDPEIDIVIELIGGEEPATDYILRSFAAKKSVITANKMALAKAGGALEQAAKEAGVKFYFEAAVAGAIPILQSISQALQANRITEISGIVNGTTNYILSAMSLNGQSYRQALAEAQRLGFAEADPTSDVEGFDSVYKFCILCKQAFGSYPKPQHITRKGISELTEEDLRSAQQKNSEIKLIGRAFLKENEPHVVVGPQEIPDTHPLAKVNGATNAISVQCDQAGEIFLQGAGAGARPTASAVVGDLIRIVYETL